MSEAATIKAGRIEVSQDDDAATVTITHKGKAGASSLVIDSVKLERWAVRILREEMFAVDPLADASAQPE
jgi:hypothetical protein